LISLNWNKEFADRILPVQRSGRRLVILIYFGILEWSCFMSMMTCITFLSSPGLLSVCLPSAHPGTL